VKALVVEDNEVSTFLARALLEQLGYEVDVTADGESAVTLVTGGDYAVVLMDTQLPVLDGLDATRRIRAFDGPAARTPIIAVTASTSARARDECLAAGMDEHLAKPLRPEEVRAVLVRLTGPVGEGDGDGDAGPAAVEAEADIDVGDLTAELAALEDRLGPPAREAFRLFLDRSQQRSTDLIAALNGADLDRVKDIAHSIRGATGALGAMALADLGGHLEDAAERGAVEECRQLGAAVVAEARRFEIALERQLAGGS
jgi:CheY-like chemotaxis protein